MADANTPVNERIKIGTYIIPITTYISGKLSRTIFEEWDVYRNPESEREERVFRRRFEK